MTAVGRRNSPAWRRFNNGEGVPVAGEGSDEVLQLEKETGDEGRSTAEGDDGRGWELTKGGSRWRRRLHFRQRRRASGGRPWKGGRGLKWCSWHACEGGTEGEKKGAGGVGDAF
jgi:hypothetical protein